MSLDHPGARRHRQKEEGHEGSVLRIDECVPEEQRLGKDNSAQQARVSLSAAQTVRAVAASGKERK
jgi:hypothetical protein